MLDFGGDDEDHPMHGDSLDQQKDGTQTPIARSLPFTSVDAPSFFGAAVSESKLAFPGGNNLAARRAASGKLPSKALLSLQQMRFEASGEAGMGLGVGPPTSGLDAGSPGPGAPTLNAFNGKEGRSPLPSPGIENVALPSPSLGPIPLRWSPKFNNSKLPRSPGMALPGTPSMSDTLKPSRRGANLRINLGAAGAYSPASSPLPSPSSPHVMRSSAFVISNTGPRTPLTPSHLPGAPSLGGGNESFDWFAYSMPDSPGCPAPPPGAQVASERSCYFSDLTPASPSSSNGTYLPTPGSERGRTPVGRTFPVSPLGQGRFAGPANPFFVST